MGFQDDNISAEIHDADILPMSAGSCRRGSANSPLPNGARFVLGIWYGWWKKSGDHQLRFVVEIPLFTWVLYIQTGVVWDFWTINSTWELESQLLSKQELGIEKNLATIFCCPCFK